jgi:hypothetical protein
MSELKDAFRQVIDYIDSKMEEEPSQKLADTSNNLEDILEGLPDGE